MFNFASKASFQNKFFGAAKPTAECNGMSDEEAAAEFQKIIESNNG